MSLGSGHASSPNDISFYNSSDAELLWIHPGNITEIHRRQNAIPAISTPSYLLIGIPYPLNLPFSGL